MRSQRNSRNPNRRPLNRDASPFNVQNLPYSRRSDYQPRITNFNSVALPMNVQNLPYGRGRNRDHLPYVESIYDYTPPLITPATAGEDGIVMDGIPAPRSSRGGSELSTRLPPIPRGASHSNRGGGRPVSTRPLAGGAGIETTNTRNNEPCFFFTTRGTCPNGSNCEYAHSRGPPRELQRPPCSSGEIKHEIFSWSSNLEGSASSSYGKNDSPIIQAKSTSAAEEAFTFPSAMAFSTAPVQVKHLSGSAIPSSSAPKVNQRRSDWSPLDDGIEINLASTKNPPNEDVDAYIREVLSDWKIQ
ncbi:hypothetical protein CASFOL_035824 [Castilleja foliolosa]|uniref:C3H1-type domain-containing protein n=1 Tax=Castilleja foliolosa TaxID=1961234 RepID=A0ABD3BW40_9LAMI